VAVGSFPTVLFHGTLRYPPNADAARFLAREVGPRLRTLIEDVRIRLVGITSPALNRLHDPPRLIVVDHVPDISTELARADVVVVPVRFGSGTRVKILEAFSHRIPVVSTTIGAEGLGARDGVHLLIADDARTMAEACSRVLSDTALRDALTTRAFALFLEHFESGVVEETIRRVAAGAVRT
jgi:glycosyltransferase involved in cell wall biosynthesis